MKKSFLIIILGLLLLNIFAVADFSLAKEKIEITLFYSQTCSHCADEKKFLDKLTKEYPEIEITELVISEKKNTELLDKLYEEYRVPSQEHGLVPVTFIAKRYFIGYQNEESTGQEIKNYLQSLLSDGGEPKPSTDPDKKIHLPFLGEIDPGKYSLPVLAVILGFFDGFNVCSLGALILILGMVIALKSRKRALVLGGIFILTTAIIYGILIFLWYQIFLALAPYLRKMEIVIGVLSILGGVYFLREFLKFKKSGPACQYEGISQKLGQKVQKALQQKSGIFVLMGVVFSFAALITIIEFPCSAVLPVLFAGILTQAGLPFFLSLLYISLFLLFYMLDEIIIFLIAVFSMRLWVGSPKFFTWINLFAAMMLFLLGAYYIIGLI